MEMIYALKERIGKPHAFYGRKEELEYFLNWVDGVPNEISKSTAILSRRKKGKTAIVERLYNLIYSQNKNIIPFYYEVKESKFSIRDISIDFYGRFTEQYIAFKTRNENVIYGSFGKEGLKKYALENGLDIIVNDIIIMDEKIINSNDIDVMNYAFSAPHRIAKMTGQYVVQIIDEFQYFNKFICKDEELNIQYDLAGIYMSLAESKVAPVIATGSWVNWLRHILRSLLPARFKEFELESFTEEEGMGAVINYSKLTGIEVSEDMVPIIAKLAENDPYYISAVIMSRFKGKDLTTDSGVLDTVEFEVTKGDIYWTWMEYIDTTFDTVNHINAKKIVLYLSSEGKKECGIQEIIDKCKLDMDERECTQKLKMLQRGDLIERGSSAYFYRGLGDNLLRRVLRKEYGYLIEHFDTSITLNEDKERDKETIAAVRKEMKKLKGQLSYHKGHAMEYYIGAELRKIKVENIEMLKLKVENYIEGSSFKPYKIIKNNYFIQFKNGENREIDIWAETEEEEILLIECKKTTKKIGIAQAKEFIEKVKFVREEGYIVSAIFYSELGFTKSAEKVMRENEIMWSYLEKWGSDGA